MRPRAALCALVVAAGSARAAPTIAISYFDNNSGQADLQPLAKGLADMLITDLAGIEAVRIVEREKLNAALGELALSKSKFIDPKTALKLGKGLAAEYIMTGGYTVAAGAMRIDVRVFKVDSGQVVASEHVEGKQAEFFALEKELVDILVGALPVKLGREDKVKLRVNPTQSFEAWSSYSAALDAHDRGDDERARELFAKALSADPGYLAAKTALERLQAVVAQSDRATQAFVDTELKNLDPKAKDFAAKVEDLLLKLDWTNNEQSRKKTLFLLWLGKRGLLGCVKTSGPAPDSPHVLHDGVPAGGVISHCRQAHEVLLIANEFLDDPQEWEHIPKVCENLIRRLPRDLAIVSYCKSTLGPGIEEMKQKPGEAQVHDAPNMKAMLAAYAAMN